MTALERFFTSCFNQDWGLDFQTFDDAISDYKQRAGADHVRLVAGELRQALLGDLPPSAIEAFGGNIQPPHGMTDRELLELVLSLLEMPQRSDSRSSGREPPP